MSTPVTPPAVRIFLSMNDGPIKKAIRQVIPEQPSLMFVNSVDEADLIVATEIRSMEKGFSEKKAYAFAHFDKHTPLPTLPPNVTVISDTGNILMSLLTIIETVRGALAKQVREQVQAGTETPKVPLLPDAMSILVVDDNELHRNAARKQLAGHKLTILSDYEEAMKVLGEQKFDTALLDLHLPMCSQTLSPSAFKLGAETPYGTYLAIEAARKGVRNIAVVTDISHHEDAISAVFDHFQQFPIVIWNSFVHFMHAHICDGGAKDWKFAMEKLME